ncbi:hypothetical protein NC651_034744 [Populus alba x Populus x berolinensis]|nr:hypothetical protein NC651_034744 [Populus alba x Populus x berolinensis]
MRQFLYRQRKEISIPGSEESGADGGSGLLCCFLRSGKERADGGSTPLLVLSFLLVLCSSVGFASSLFSLLSCSLPLPLSSLHSILSVLFSAVLLLFSLLLPSRSPIFFLPCSPFFVLLFSLFFLLSRSSPPPPPFPSGPSPFYSQNCMRFFFIYNEDVQDHYYSGNGREIVAVKRSP